MRKVVVFLVMSAVSALAQTTTTNCSELDAFMETSSSAYLSDDARTDAPDPQQWNQTGKAFGSMIASSTLASRTRRYCRQHPGEAWSFENGYGRPVEGTCPTVAEQSALAIQHFVRRHKDYVACVENKGCR